MAMKLLLVGDERKSRRMIAWAFSGADYQVKQASTPVAAERLVAEEAFHLACIDFPLPPGEGMVVIDRLRGKLPQLPLIALLGGRDRKVVQFLKGRGVTAHLTSPFPVHALRTVVATYALKDPVGGVRREATFSRPAVPSAGPQLLTNDASAERTLQLARRAANSNAAILLLGETGTGKSVLAQTIHQHSPIRQQPFVTVNCPCLSHELLESDLFGHVRGAFTGAVQDTWGKVAVADGGTLFLDEIGDLPMSIQPKLLRLLQEKQYERVGEATPRTAQVRIIAATNRDLKREVAAGRFREDLYYRLNVIAIDVPALRSRPSQIMGMAEVFLATVCQQLGKTAPAFSAEARRILESYAWPGNLRELRNVVERAAILSTDAVLEAADFPALGTPDAPARYQIGGAISLQALENAHIQMVVASSGSLEEAARILAIDKSTLYRKRKSMEARVTRFSPLLENAPLAISG
jgi:two-component system, NtrC family, response regulator AlgB